MNFAQIGVKRPSNAKAVRQRFCDLQKADIFFLSFCRKDWAVGDFAHASICALLYKEMFLYAYKLFAFDYHG